MLEAAVGVASSLSVVVAGRRGGGAICGCSGVLDVVAGESRRVLACKTDELVALAALGHLDTVPVAPLLDLAITPAVEELVAQGLLSTGSRGRRGGGGGCSRVGSDTSIAAKRGDHLVAVVGLRVRDTTLIEPSLEVRVGPGLVDPVTGVRSGLASLVRRRLEVGADSLEERIAGAWGRIWHAMVVEEGLELGLSPATQS